MRVKTSFLAIALAMVAPAMAQPADQVNAPDCKAEQDALEREIGVARSKGQMLQRRRLDQALTALHARCKTLAPQASREDRIEQLEQEIRELRLELDRAEHRLRELKDGNGDRSAS